MIDDDELMKKLKGGSSSPQFKEGEIEVHKFIVEFQHYKGSGKVFTKMYPIGKELRSQAKKKKRTFPQSKVVDEEVY